MLRKASLEAKPSVLTQLCNVLLKLVLEKIYLTGGVNPILNAAIIPTPIKAINPK